MSRRNLTKNPSITPSSSRVSNNIAISSEQLTNFCQRWKIKELALFGSVLREDFRPDSDIDVLVSFSEDAHWSLFDLVEMEDELSTVFGRKVDFIERAAIQNPFRRRAILNSLEVLYAS